MPAVNHDKKILEADSVSFSYGTNEALHGISLDVHEGDYLGIVGPNGAGKTTLLKIMVGLLRPTKGTVKLFGEDIFRTKRRGEIAYVPQKAVNFDAKFPATVAETVLMGRAGKLGIFSRIGKKDREIAEKSLEMVGMSAFSKRQIGELSGGQQQRVFIARALASEPKIIFLDEPTVGIDPKSQDEFYELMRRMNREMNLTLVLVSHDIEKVVKEVMHVACVDKTLTCHETPEEFLKDSVLENLAGEAVKVMRHHH